MPGAMKNTTMQKNNGISFKTIISTQYFLYFGILGVSLPYFNLYCYHLGFNGFQIGMLSAFRTLAMLLFPLIWGRLADRFQSRRPIYILANFVSAGLWVFYLFTDDFYSMLMITVCYEAFHAPIISFLEAFTMDLLGDRKKSYGRVRVWGSAAFIAVSLLLGKIISLYSIDIILALILAGSVIQAMLSLQIPAAVRVRSEKISRAWSEIWGPEKRKRVIFFLISAFLMLVSHGTYYGFFSIHLEKAGCGSAFIGMAWALASLSEILVMIHSDKIFRRFSIENVLIFSFAVAGLRWFILFFAASPVIILISQLFHAITYGTFHVASILYIDSLTPAEAKTTGQAVNNAVTYGLGMTVGFFMNGFLYESFGSFALFGISGFIALGGGLLLVFENRKYE